MGFVFLFVAIIAAIVIWWLSRQRLFAKPRHLLALPALDLADRVWPSIARIRRVTRQFHRTLHVGDPRHEIG